MKKPILFGILFLIVLLLTTVFPGQKSGKIPQHIPSFPSPTPIPSLTIEKIFSEDHSWWEKLPKDHIRIMTATGDIIPARSVNFGAVKRNNPLWPYEKVVPILRKQPTDILFINLETPLIKNCPATVEGMIFCGSDRNIEGLTYLGVTVASVANNHAGNYGVEGVKQTVDLLRKTTILVAGIDGPVYQTVRGKTFAFLGFNDITSPQPGVQNVDKAIIKNQIQKARKKADIVVVTYHWGVEYRSQPDDRQIELGHFTIDSGADIVIGNHPHWIQPIEFYKGKLITYAHGNFIFDQMWSQKTREGVIGRYIFYDNTLIDVKYLPLQIDDYGQAHFLEGMQKTSILTDMKNQSEIRATK